MGSNSAVGGASINDCRIGISKFVEAHRMKLFRSVLEIPPMGLIFEEQILSATDETQSKSKVSSKDRYVHLLMNNHILYNSLEVARRRSFNKVSILSSGGRFISLYLLKGEVTYAEPRTSSPPGDLLSGFSAFRPRTVGNSCAKR